jgi:hypothetical protein
VLDYPPDVLIRWRSRADTIRGAIARNSRSGVEAEMVAAARIEASPRALTRILVVLTAAMALVLMGATPAVAAVYNPLLVISEENWRDTGSMSQADIQAFLEAPLPGEGASVLAKYSCPEFGTHGGAVKKASQIIWEACQKFNLNPKVILATLEKEQSLITQHPHLRTAKHSHGTDYHIMYALGVGVYAGSTNWNPGFGDQVYGAAERFGTLPGVYSWTPGKIKNVHSYPDGGRHIDIVPLNAPTWALYTYTPYYPQISFWNQYVRFFGDPLAPPRFKQVHRIENKSTGAHLWTVSLAEKYRLLKTLGRRGRYDGVAFTLDTSSTANVAPVWRIYNRRTRKYYYTASTAARDKMIRTVSGTRVDGPAFLASTTGGTPVYQIYNTASRTYYYTVDVAERAHMMKRHRYRDRGVAFYLGPAPAASEATSSTTSAIVTTATAGD